MTQSLLRSLIAAALALFAAGCTRCQSPSALGSAGAKTDSSHVVDTVPTPAANDDVQIFPAEELARVADELARGPNTARTVSALPTLRYVEARRATSGEPEVHADWTDVTVVQSGRATLVTGGRAEGTRTTSPGELRGGVIRGGRARVVRAGDSVIIPAGVPHQYQLAAGDSIRYLTIKVAR